MTRRRSWNSSLPAPTQPIARSRVPRVNATRKPANLERAHGPAKYRAWIKQQPCVVCGRTPCDAAHIKTGGGSRKADVDQTVPMCSSIVATGYVGHHDEYDGRARAGGKATFAARYPSLDLPALAVETQRAWRAFSGEGS